MHVEGLWHWYQIKPKQMKIAGFLKVYIVLLVSQKEYTYSQFVGCSNNCLMHGKYGKYG
jgi:hypothetical protein